MLPDPSSTLTIRSQVVPTPIYAGHNQSNDKNISAQTTHRPLTATTVQSIVNGSPQDLVFAVSESEVLKQSKSHPLPQADPIDCADSLMSSHTLPMPNLDTHIPNQDAHVLASLEMEKPTPTLAHSS
jgi:hypothetical protein